MPGIPGIRATPRCGNCREAGHNITMCHAVPTRDGIRSAIKGLIRYKSGFAPTPPVTVRWTLGSMSYCYRRGLRDIYEQSHQAQMVVPLARPPPEPIIVDLYEDDCPVCLEEGVQCRRPACNHSLCLDCYVDLKNRKPDATCPLCRGVMM